MAAETNKTAKAKKGVNPLILVLGALALVVLVVNYLPGLLKGSGRGSVARPVPTAPVPAGTASSAPGNTPGAAQTPAEAPETAAPPASSELTTFLVRFGRSNPFAPFSAGSGRSMARAGAASNNSTLGGLKERAKKLQEGATITTGPNNTAGGNTGETVEGFTLTGIVRYESLALAVIAKDGKAYYVMAGESLGKTGYRVRAVNEESVVICSGEKELVLSLRRKKT